MYRKKLHIWSTFLTYFSMTKVKNIILFFCQNTLYFHMFGTLKHHTYYHQRANLMILIWFLGINNDMVLIRSIFYIGKIRVTFLQVNRQVLWVINGMNRVKYGFYLSIGTVPLNPPSPSPNVPTVSHKQVGILV